MERQVEGGCSCVRGVGLLRAFASEEEVQMRGVMRCVGAALRARARVRMCMCVRAHA